ncbi:MAG: hypothetical protein ABW199_08245 [Caulobacterales bacterium]
MLFYAWIAAALALSVMGAIALRSLCDPKWGAKLVRLRDDPNHPGGFAEFRATFGGVFFASHAAAILLIVQYVRTERDQWGIYASGAVLVLGAAYAGAAFGRVLSMFFDKTRTPSNISSTAFEAGAALMLWAPWIIGLFGPFQ